MDYDGYSGRPDGPSLAVQLMQVAGSFELERKRERTRMESKLAEQAVLLAASESELRNLKESHSSLQKRANRLQGELDVSLSTTESHVLALQRTLLETRWQLAERLDELQTLQQSVVSLTSVCSGTLAAVQEMGEGASLDENDDQSKLLTVKSAVEASRKALLALTPSLANVVPSPEKIESVRKAARNAAQWSRPAFLRAVETGNELAAANILAGKVDEEGAGAVSPGLSTALGCALRLAISSGNQAMCRQLMACGADIGVRSIEDGLFSTVLHAAAEGGQEGMLKMLVGRDSSGAAVSSNPSPAQVAGLSIDDCDAYGRTPLHCAASRNAAGVVKMLLLCGADPFIRDVHGHTPLEVTRGTEQFRACEGRESSRTGWAYAACELPCHPPCPSAAEVLQHAYVLFWNASVRANRYYNERAFEKAVEAYSRALELSTTCGTPMAARDVATLHYNRARARYRQGAHCEAVEDCSAALRTDGSYRNAMAQRAECYMGLFDFERAVRDFQGLLESDPSDRQWVVRLSEARAMRDMSHYGMLGLRKDADASAIKKAYRALCLRWHPDKVESNGGGGAGGGSASAGTGHEAAVRANTVFRRLTEGYETLSDSYKRMIYDIDPRSNSGTPVGSSKERGGVDREGFERWAGREREKEDNRERERTAAAAMTAAANAAEDSLRAAARATRRKLVATGSIPSCSTSGSTQTEAVPAPTSLHPARPPPAAPAQPRVHAPAAVHAHAAHTSTGTGAGAWHRGARDEVPAPAPSSSPAPTTTNRSFYSYSRESGEGLTSGHSSAPGSLDTTADSLQAAAAATAARARAAVAQAEAFVRLVQSQSQGGPGRPVESTSSSSIQLETVPTRADTSQEGEYEMDGDTVPGGSGRQSAHSFEHEHADKAAVRARVEARARADAAARLASELASALGQQQHQHGPTLPRPGQSRAMPHPPPPRAAWPSAESHPFAIPRVSPTSAGSQQHGGGSTAQEKEEGDLAQDDLGSSFEEHMHEAQGHGYSGYPPGDGGEYDGEREEEEDGEYHDDTDAESELLRRLDEAAALAAAGARGLHLSEEELQEILERIGQA